MVYLNFLNLNLLHSRDTLGIMIKATTSYSMIRQHLSTGIISRIMTLIHMQIMLMLQYLLLLKYVYLIDTSELNLQNRLGLARLLNETLETGKEPIGK